MTKDDGETITVIAENVGRLFGVGDKFVVYTQNDAIMVYFWESGRYARLTAPGKRGCWSNHVFPAMRWYGAMRIIPINNRTV